MRPDAKLPMPQPLVSVIVPTYNRDEALCETLAYLFYQDYPNYEIVVVDQTVEHNEQTNRFLRENCERLRLIKLAKPSLTKARNAGIAHARGDIILFLDDDIIPVESLISAHVAALSEDGVGAVAGQILSPDSGAMDTLEVGLVRHKSTIVSNFNSMVALDVQHAPGGNTSAWRDLVLRAGSFEPAFGGTAIREETDLYLRLRYMGYRIKFEPSASILHLEVVAGGCGNRRSDVRWYFWFAHNNILLALRHPTYLSLGRVMKSQLKVLARKKGPLLLAPWLLAHLYAPISFLYSRKSLPSAFKGERLTIGLSEPNVQVSLMPNAPNRRVRK